MIILAVQAFHPYFMGFTFMIEMDHRLLEWLNNLKDSDPRLTSGACSCIVTPFKSRTTLEATMVMQMDSPAYSDIKQV